jgi:hypothetical protein
VVIECMQDSVYEDGEKLVAVYCTRWINQVIERLDAAHAGYVRIMRDQFHCYRVHAGYVRIMRDQLHCYRAHAGYIRITRD